VTPEEFAAQTGLSVEEATLILNRRSRAEAEVAAGGRVELARVALSKAQKKVGVHPVAANGEELEKMYDPDADVGRSRFYGKKDSLTQVVAEVDVWEEPP
jgi:hypothetical protein